MSSPHILMTRNKKFLVVAPSWVGDLVMSQALLRHIKNRYPDCSIDVFASSYLHPLLRRMPEVNSCIESNFNHGDLKLIERFNVGKGLRGIYDHAYVLPNSIKSALVPFFAKIPIRTGWRGEQRFFLLNDIRSLDKKKLPLMVERLVSLGNKKNEQLVKPFLFPKLHVSKEQLNKTLSRLDILLPKKPVLVLCPGAEYGLAKRWPIKYFAEVANIKIKEGWDVWILGGAKERIIANNIQKICNNRCVDFTGRTDLGEVVDLLSLATVVVSNDSGLMHISAALDLPLVAIYGSSSPNYTPPLLDDKKLRILSLNLSCSPCFKRECPLGHTNCLNDLKPDIVLGAILEVSK